MAKFTPIENKLISRINKSDDRLGSNLAKIREAMEDLWTDDPVRIIQHYTDHGVKHSQRLVGYAVKLLNANKKVHLSDQEMYLLIASIYLHDIGMQCDIIKFPKIKSIAESLGAKFNIEFELIDGGYSREMQKSIRKNHHYLAAAWIDFANQTGETRLGPVAREIDPNLVNDLMDICKYHSKLPIDECPINSCYFSGERKQLVAALLRFSDELDIDAHRINIETVKNFSIDPDNSVYWWLHNRTVIEFITNNMIRINMQLHPNDMFAYSSLIKEVFIDKFSRKNGPILDILCKNDIPIYISSDSKVVENNRIDLLPPDIVNSLKKMKKQGNIQDSLAEEIRGWLESIGYEVSPSKKFGDRALDIEATLGRGLMHQTVLIRCYDGEINRTDLEILDENPTPQKWAITDKRVSPSARDYAHVKSTLKVFNLTDFMREIWGPYFDELKNLIKENRIQERYIDLACYKQEMDDTGQEIYRDKYVSLDEYLDDWLKERGKMHISILGEFGTGKTWFCRHYAFRQYERYLRDPINERLPLLITLREFNKATTPQQLINDALLEKYKLHFVGSAYEVFQKINKNGKLLLILDGFDEMAQKSSYQTIADNFWELAELIDLNSKVILTSRKEYFSAAKESEKILSGREYGRKKRDLSPPEFEILNLEPFSDSQIREVIQRRLGLEKGKSTADKIMKIPNLSEMARKPILIELLLAALDEIGGDALENSAQVYLYATNNLLLRNITTHRTFTATTDKLYFLCELAWEMIKSEQLNMHYKDITKKIGAYFKDKIKGRDELDNWDLDLRSQTLLHRNAAGYYEFAHKSLAEYFIAYKFAAELGCMAPLFAQAYKEEGNKECALPITKKDNLSLVDSFGAISFRHPKMKVIKGLLKEILAENANKRLWEVIDSTRGRTFEQLKFVGGNAATLLQTIGASFENADLAQTILAEADLTGCNLLKTNLTNCDLTEADLRGCKINDATLKSAKLANTLVAITSIIKEPFPVKSPGSVYKVFNKKYNKKIFEIISQNGGHISFSEFYLMGEMDRLIVFHDCKINEGFNWTAAREEILKVSLIHQTGLYENEIEELYKTVPELERILHHEWMNPLSNE